MDVIPNGQLDERIAKRKRQNVERVLRCRKRKQAGSRCVRIEVTDWAATLAAFIKIGVLSAEQRDDDKAIEAAIAILCRRGYRAIRAERETDRDDNRWECS